MIRVQEEEKTPNKVVASYTINQRQKEALEIIAKERDTSASTIVREAIESYLKQLEEAAA